MSKIVDGGCTADVDILIYIIMVVISIIVLFATSQVLTIWYPDNITSELSILIWVSIALLISVYLSIDKKEVNKDD